MNETELERLMVRLVGDGTQYQRMLTQAERQTAGFASRLQVHTRSINAFGMQMRGYAGAAGGQVAGLLGVGGAVATVGSAIGKYAQREQTEIAFEALIGDAQKSKAALKDLYRFAAETPFESPEILASAKQMIAFGESAENIVPTMKSLGDVSAGLNIPLGQLTYLFGTLKSQQIAHTVDINQFAMRGIPIWQELEKITGKNNAELRQMVEHGQIGFPIIEQAFKNMTAEGGKFHGQLEKQSKSILGLFSTLKDNVGMTLADLGQDISESLDLKGLLKDVVDVTNKFAELFKGLSPETKRLMITIGGVALAFGSLLVIAPMLASVFGPALALLGGMVGSVLSLVSPLGIVIALVGSLAYVFFSSTKAGGESLAWLGKQIDALADHFKPVWEGMKDAIATGDLEMAFKIAVTSMKTEWARFNVFFTTYWNATKDSFIDTWQYDALGGVKKGIIGFMHWTKANAPGMFKQMFGGMGDFMVAGGPDMEQKQKDAVDREMQILKDGRKAAREADMKDAEEKLKEMENKLSGLQMAAKFKRLFHGMFNPEEGLKAAAQAAQGMPAVPLKLVPKFDAAEWGSADMQARIAEWRDKMGINPTRKGHAEAIDVRGGAQFDNPNVGAGQMADENLRKIFEKIEENTRNAMVMGPANLDDFGGGEF